MVPKSDRVIRVLAIDGGGMRGIIPAMLLEQIESQTGRRIADLFDLVVGTSTGALIALALCSRNGNGAPIRTAGQVLDLYLRYGKDVFSRGHLRKTALLGNLLGPKYRSTGIMSVLERFLDDSEIQDLFPHVIITAYGLESRAPICFRSRTARLRPEMRERSTVEIARAAIAAPTYFKPSAISQPGEQSSEWCIDGGVFANNPGLCALTEARRMYPRSKILLVSLGTGEVRDPIPPGRAIRWGVLGWARDLVSVVFDGTSQYTSEHLEHLLAEDAYFRFQVNLPKRGISLDDSRPRTLRTLRALGRLLIQQERERLTVLGNSL